MEQQSVLDAEALAECPQLAGVVRLRDAGWKPMATAYAEDGERDALRLYYLWDDGTMDLLIVRSDTQAIAVRLIPGPPPARIWDRIGGLEEVAAAVLELPEPSARHAPKLVIGRADPAWTRATF